MIGNCNISSSCGIVFYSILVNVCHVCLLLVVSQPMVAIGCHCQKFSVSLQLLVPHLDPCKAPFSPQQGNRTASLAFGEALPISYHFISRQHNPFEYSPEKFPSVPAASYCGENDLNSFIMFNARLPTALLECGNHFSTALTSVQRFAD